MAIDDRYRRQVQLLVQLLPIVSREKDFALKGGTAINMFDSDMPRLSVDIDLTYLGLETRTQALAHCREILGRLAEEIERRLPGTRVERRFQQSEEIRLNVRVGNTLVKIESSPVARGAVGPVEVREIRPRVQDEFGYAAIQCISTAEIYGGKICAALDRQHPRDLFDIGQLMDRNGLTREVFDGFLVALMSSRRPMAEILDPNRKDLTDEFVEEFHGMVAIPVRRESLEQARECLIQKIAGFMTMDDRSFLLSFKRDEPDWERFAYPKARALPAIRWKRLNLDKMTPDRRKAAIDRLNDVLAKMT
mgnify:CR=1 FL=1